MCMTQSFFFFHNKQFIYPEAQARNQSQRCVRTSLLVVVACAVAAMVALLQTACAHSTSRPCTPAQESGARASHPMFA